MNEDTLFQLYVKLMGNNSTVECLFYYVNLFALLPTVDCLYGRYEKG